MQYKRDWGENKLLFMHLCTNILHLSTSERQRYRDRKEGVRNKYVFVCVCYFLNVWEKDGERKRKREWKTHNWQHLIREILVLNEFLSLPPIPLYQSPCLSDVHNLYFDLSHSIHYLSLYPLSLYTHTNLSFYCCILICRIITTQ